MKHGSSCSAVEVMLADHDGSEPDESGKQVIPPINASLGAGPDPLWQAYRYAQDAGADVWDLAPESDRVYDTGPTIDDLRRLIAKGFAEHGREMSFHGDPHRSFRPSRGLIFVPTTCFVLTAKGAEFAGRILREPAAAR